jgi:hypothetical protein
MSCRTGSLRGRRSLRDSYTGQGRTIRSGPPVGRRDLSSEHREDHGKVHTSRSDRLPRREPVRQDIIFLVAALIHAGDAIVPAQAVFIHPGPEEADT